MMKAVGRMLNSEIRLLFSRYAQFCIVGGSGVVVDMAIIWLLADPELLHWNLTLSKVIAAEVAIFNNFLWNDIWTFRGLGAGQSNWRSRLIRFLKFNLICLVGIALSVVLLNIQVSSFQMNVYLANFTSIVVASVWNFLMNLKFGWRKANGTVCSLDSAESVQKKSSLMQ